MRTTRLGDALTAFDTALRRFREALSADSQLVEAIFAGTEEWMNLLSYKLVPHLAGDGCLIVAVTGGTNTGKSTVFNMLAGRAVSPVRPTAAATARPVIAANAFRTRQCLAGKLVPEFRPFPLTSEEEVLSREAPTEGLFVAQAEDLPDRIVLLDTPDVDSIERAHWGVAENLRAAGDVLVAVLTAEKYRDERVVSYFRRALASGRLIAPVMNKANPADDFAVACRQLEEFCQDVGATGPLFAVAHDFDVADNYAQPIPSIDGTTDLAQYLRALDAPVIKRRVHRATVAHFVERAKGFVAHIDDVAAVLRSVAEEFESRTHRYASKYDPAPGAAVGGLFHEFVQSRRGAWRRWIGATSRSLVTGVRAVGKAVARTIRKRATLDTAPAPCNDDEIRQTHVQAIERIARDLIAGLVESCRNLREPAAHLVRQGLDGIEAEAVIRAVIADTVRSENVSAEFRRHAYKMLDAWWSDHRGRRHALEALDALLAVVPAAIAVPMSFYTGGVGVSEALAVAGPFVEQFLARVIEYQFGDAMFDFLSPWRREQQQGLENALRAHLVGPALARVEAHLAMLQGEIVAELRQNLAACEEA